MNKMNTFRMVAPAVAVAVSLAFSGQAVAQDKEFKWPRLLVIGTAGTGSGSFASTNGWVPMLQNSVDTTVRVVPEDNESMRFRRLTDRKDIKISSVAAAEMRFQTEGLDGYAGAKPVAQRILWHHNDTPWGLVVSGDSEIKTVEDIMKGGVRMAKGMYSPPMINMVVAGVPGFLGMTPAEAEKVIEYVPASSYNENCRSVVEGKADVAFCAPISSVLSEMEGAPGGIRWIDLPAENKEGWAGYMKADPMFSPSEITLGVKSARGHAGGTSTFVYSVTADTETDFAYNMAKWIHTSFDSYKDTHPLAARMSLDLFRKYLDQTPMPVHEGTVKYLKEIGAWTEADDVWNNAAIEKMDKFVAARNDALKEAAKAGIRADFQDEKFLTILRKHTGGIEGFSTRL